MGETYLKKVFKIVIFSIILFLLVLSIFNEIQAKRIDRELVEMILSEKDKESIKEFINIKTALGDKIWLGIDDIDIPVVVFNDKYEFLVGYSGEIKNWDTVNEDNFYGEVYYRRLAENFQAFTVKINDLWAGSMPTIGYLNKDLFLMLRKELPMPINKLIPYQMIRRPQDFYMTAIMHECFHAYQANESPNKFQQSENNYKLKNKYPFYDEKLNELFTQEGQILSNALLAEDRNEMLKLAKEFLDIRDERRSYLTPNLINYEQTFEWLEGLAKYVEIKTYEVALSEQKNLSLKYNKKMPYWNTEIENIKRLGSLESETRFYVSGMAQAKLLEKLGVNWEEKIMDDNIYFDDILRDIINKYN